MVLAASNDKACRIWTIGDQRLRVRFWCYDNPFYHFTKSKMELPCKQYLAVFPVMIRLKILGRTEAFKTRLICCSSRKFKYGKNW